MGIRYLAISIDQQDFDHLRVGTCQHCGEEPQLREMDDPTDDRRDTLDLDKSWSYLQEVLHAEPARASAALVTGHVTNTGWGWRSYRGLIAADEVAAIAADLESVSPELIHQRLVTERRPGYETDDRARANASYVAE